MATSQHEPTSGKSGRTTPAPHPAEKGEGPPSWLRRATITLAVVLVLILVAIAAAAFLPAWWANSTSSWVGGNSASGILLGLTIGVVFTLIPFIGIWLAARRKWPLRVRIVVAGVSALFALPNVLTFTINIAPTDGTEQARLTMVANTPAFTGASLIGVIAALVGAVAVIVGMNWVRQLRIRANSAPATPPIEKAKRSQRKGVQ